jgi:hypothetical protein
MACARAIEFTAKAIYKVAEYRRRQRVYRPRRRGGSSLGRGRICRRTLKLSRADLRVVHGGEVIFVQRVVFPIVINEPERARSDLDHFKYPVFRRLSLATYRLIAKENENLVPFPHCLRGRVGA